MDIDFTIVRKRASPLVQFVVSLLIGWSGMGICKLLHATPSTEYFASFIAIIFFCLINIVVSIAYQSYLRYTIPSFYLYILLVVVLFLSAKFLSGVSIWDLYEYRMMLISVTIFYFIGSNMVRILRLIYDAAEKGF
jgi:hypothetical protein